jgi:D-3-phosphoglycerate dehydrogenase
MNKRKVLITAPYFQPVVEKYQDVFDLNNIEIIVLKVKEMMSEQELLDFKSIGKIDGIICGDDEITEKVLSKAVQLKVISKWGTGIDSIDKEAAAKHSIPVFNTPNAFTDAVADTVFGFMLCFARQIPRINEEMKQGLWQKRKGISLKECVLGVIGVGNIGKAVTRRAKAFEMRVLGNDIKEIPSDFVKETGLEVVSLETLLKEADFISVNCDLNPTSHDLIDEKAFSLMKPTSYIINTARGSIINEQALIKALSSKKIAGAALDVFEKEPLPQDNPLRQFSNVILSPHNANASLTAWERVHENTLQNLIEELNKHIDET